MRRSEINAAIQTALETLEKCHFHLPPFAHWTQDDWRRAGAESERMKRTQLGWDITDFGSGNFERIGAVLMTIRNGNVEHPRSGTPYAEKVIIMKPGQKIPLHFHWTKTEDIINRGGGTLVIKLYNDRDDESVDVESPVSVFCDGVVRTLPAGGTLILNPGESITLTPHLYHEFWAGEDGGVLVAGEVSSINDDRTDNHFTEPVSRFAKIEEDEPPIRLLCNEYP